MATDRISIRVPPSLRRRLRDMANATGRQESTLVREALERYDAGGRAGESCYDLARRTGLVGAVKHAPRDLSTNRTHFRGFGR